MLESLPRDLHNGAVVTHDMLPTRLGRNGANARYPNAACLRLGLNRFANRWRRSKTQLIHVAPGQNRFLLQRIGQP